MTDRRAEQSAGEKRCTVAHVHEDLVQRIKTLEKELNTALEGKEQAFRYSWANGKARFEHEVLSQHRKFKHSLVPYILHSRFLVLVTAPMIYVGFIPFSLLDLFVWIYQAVCFRVYGIPRVKREDYLVFDRGQLRYLNLLERVNCIYCSYANGLCAYVTEVAARTEQHWCPIKHARRIRAPHSRYTHFFDYGNAEQYSRQIETVRNDFVDLKSLTSKRPSRKSKE
ncbi:MAG TPA: hypothetical protein VKR61_12475 [Bryobacteraceae bacterium]|nr:hypothetical protein [Bryobacteraceae bacterium]